MHAVAYWDPRRANDLGEAKAILRENMDAVLPDLMDTYLGPWDSKTGPLSEAKPGIVALLKDAGERVKPYILIALRPGPGALENQEAVQLARELGIEISNKTE